MRVSLVLDYFIHILIFLHYFIGVYRAFHFFKLNLGPKSLGNVGKRWGCGTVPYSFTSIVNRYSSHVRNLKLNVHCPKSICCFFPKKKMFSTWLELESHGFLLRCFTIKYNTSFWSAKQKLYRAAKFTPCFPKEQCSKNFVSKLLPNTSEIIAFLNNTKNILKNRCF